MDNKTIQAVAKDTLVCLADRKDELSYYMHNWVKYQADVAYAGVNTVCGKIRIVNVISMLYKFTAFGLGYMDCSTLVQEFMKFNDEDRKYWQGGIFECWPSDSQYSYPAFRYSRLLTA